MRRSPLSLCLASIVGLTGCGSDITVPTPSFQYPILSSDQIATGAWSITEAPPSSGAPGLPITGFWGALSASGTQVQGAFTTLSTDVYGSGQVSACLQNPTDAVEVTGTASNGVLTLDGTFETNRIHFTGQLSADRASIVSGSYTVTGPCATTSTALTGLWLPPLTGTYAGTSTTANGLTEHITATLTQGDTYYGSGYIPLIGTVTLSDSHCTVTGPLLGAFVAGPFNEIIAYSTSNAGDNIRLYGDVGGTTSTIALQTWEYYEDPSCGDQHNDPANPGTLVRQ